METTVTLGATFFHQETEEELAAQAEISLPITQQTITVITHEAVETCLAIITVKITATIATTATTTTFSAVATIIHLVTSLTTIITRPITHLETEAIITSSAITVEETISFQVTILEGTAFLTVIITTTMAYLLKFYSIYSTPLNKTSKLCRLCSKKTKVKTKPIRNPETCFLRLKSWQIVVIH